MQIATAPTRLRSRPSWLLNQAARPANRLVDDALDGLGARRSDFSLLAALDEFGPDSQAALGRRCGIDRSDMVAFVNELESGGFVRRSPDPDDGRRNVITITASGRRRLAALERSLNAVQDQLLAPLSVRDAKELVRLLTLVVEHHAED